MATNESRKYVIVGAGIHGLSTAWHLAMDLKSEARAPDGTSWSWKRAMSGRGRRASPAATSETST